MVQLASEVLFFIGRFPFTNTILHTLIVDFLIILGIIAVNKNLSVIPGVFQNIIEYVIEGLYSLTKSVSEENAMKIFPYFISFFIFILIANWTSLFPGFETITIKTKDGFVPLLRGATSDINTTLALALISTIATHFMAIKTVGIKSHLLRYFSFNPIFMFVGLLEILSIFTNIISLSFRLFGNILAGEAVIATISGMFAFFLPLPFMALEIIVGVVQALVFSMLTMVFMAILSTPHNAEGGEH